LDLDVRELQLADAGAVTARHYPALSTDRPALIGELEDAALCRQLRDRLAQAYPEGHEVTVLAGLETELPVLQSVPLGRLDRVVCRGVSLLYLPALEHASSLEAFLSTVAHLRAPDGCPWDREQTHHSLRKGFLEEAYEVLDALDQGDLELLQEELGDVLLHIALQAQIGSENGEFSMRDIVRHVNDKIVYRHPHVFADLAVDGVDQVLDNWEALKRKEKGRERASADLFDGIPRSMPALARAQALLRRAERRVALAKGQSSCAERVAGALRQLEVEPDAETRSELVGEVILELAAFAASIGVDAEGALRDANARYEGRALGVASDQANGDCVSELTA
jgi:tetrapyrrole methylase family protein/MazG family protein